MKQRLFFFLAFLFGCWSLSAQAQTAPNSAASVYGVGNVGVDITAASAAKARDQAIAEAQRSAFTQLLQRFGAAPSAGANLGDNDLATLVQNFEVRDERTSSVRYLGRFFVQFRPTAVRNFLSKRHVAFNDTQGDPILIIPVTKIGEAPILWQQATPWFAAWTKAAQDGGLVPIVVPSGTPEDQTLFNASDAVLGKVEPIKLLIDNYHTSGAFVAVLNGSTDNPAAGFTIDLQHFGSGFDEGSAVEHIALQGTQDKAAVPQILNQAVEQIRQRIEKDYRDNLRSVVVDNAATSLAGGGNVNDPSLSTPMAAAVNGQTGRMNRLPVTAQFNTLAEWAEMQRRLLASPGVNRVDIASVGHGVTQIELGFTGSPEQIQASVAQQGLSLSQDILSGNWVLKGY